MNFLSIVSDRKNNVPYITSKNLIMNSPDLLGFESLCPELTHFLSNVEWIPTPFCFNLNKVNVFVLGSDPSNFSESGDATNILSTVFGLGEGDARYFSGILANLREIGLSLEDIYVQNLVRNYLNFETSKNHPVWLKFANLWLPFLKEELNAVDNSKKIPVLVTAEVIFRFLNPAMEKYKAREIYNSEDQSIVRKMSVSNDNKLGRPVIPFYRHLNYRLAKVEFSAYREFLKSVLVANKRSK